MFQQQNEYQNVDEYINNMKNEKAKKFANK